MRSCLVVAASVFVVSSTCDPSADQCQVSAQPKDNVMLQVGKHHVGKRVEKHETEGGESGQNPDNGDGEGLKEKLAAVKENAGKERRGGKLKKIKILQEVADMCFDADAKASLQVKANACGFDLSDKKGIEGLKEKLAGRNGGEGLKEKLAGRDIGEGLKEKLAGRDRGEGLKEKLAGRGGVEGLKEKLAGRGKRGDDETLLQVECDKDTLKELVKEKIEACGLREKVNGRLTEALADCKDEQNQKCKMMVVKVLGAYKDICVQGDPEMPPDVKEILEKCRNEKGEYSDDTCDIDQAKLDGVRANLERGVKDCDMAGRAMEKIKEALSGREGREGTLKKMKVLQTVKDMCFDDAAKASLKIKAADKDKLKEMVKEKIEACGLPEKVNGRLTEALADCKDEQNQKCKKMVVKVLGAYKDICVQGDPEMPPDVKEILEKCRDEKGEYSDDTCDIDQAKLDGVRANLERGVKGCNMAGRAMEKIKQELEDSDE